MDSVNPSIADFELAYAELVAIPKRPRPELILTIVPDLFFLIMGNTACVTRINPKNLYQIVILFHLSKDPQKPHSSHILHY